MDRKGFGAVLDETVSRMEHDVRVLKTKNSTLKTNIKELEGTRGVLSEKICNLEAEHTETVKKCKEEIDSMMDSAKDKLSKASLKESEASGKLSELNEKIKESEKLIKSNNGLKDNLKIQEESLKDKTDKLEILKESINDVMSKF